MFDFCMCYRGIVASTLLVYHFQCRQCNVMFQANLYKVYFTIWQLSQHSTFAQASNSGSRAVKLLFVMLLACGKCVSNMRRPTCNQADWQASTIFYRLNDECACLPKSFIWPPFVINASLVCVCVSEREFVCLCWVLQRIMC